MQIHNYIHFHTSIAETSIINTLDLLQSGATIPFIARYRKDLTQNLDEVKIFEIQELKTEFEKISQRKQTILESIKEQNLLTNELSSKIESIFDLKKLEDLYLPYKRKKKTLAATARENGLEPLAKIIMKQQNIHDLKKIAQKYVNKNVESIDLALDGAQHIISEWINENESVRNQLRKLFFHQGEIKSKLQKSKENTEESLKFKNYFDFVEPIKKIPSHRLLAILRGEKEEILKLKLSVDKKEALALIENRIIKTKDSNVYNFLKEEVKNAYSKYLEPSISNEILNEAKEKADIQSIDIFAKNLEQLLLTRPLGEKRILAIDPGFRSGCKVVCLDENGQLLHNENIYPHEPKNEKGNASKKIRSLVNAYQIDAIAIGNGTASRETEHFIQQIAFDKPIHVFIVNEAGASIYSASSIARQEFPDKDITVRGAVSIGRRLADPLAELVKIDPKSIGVGQYQHDVNQTLLKNKLDHVVEICVNKVGVNLNTASPYLLQYTSGIGEKLAENIIQYRTENGPFRNRKELLQVPRFGQKVFEQASAFLRIVDGEQVLDNSAVHPESYDLVQKMASDLNISTQELIGNTEALQSINTKNYVNNERGELYLKDLLKELEKPGLDPRKQSKIFAFDAKIKKLEDLQIGMKVPGIIQNITNFGCFVNIGIKENGLIHVSKVAKEFISDISTKVHLNQEVEATVIGIDLSGRKFQLSLID